MFQPETEDMLPRMAPKPSASIQMGANEATVRPQVPEVSILFGQDGNGQQQQISHMQQQQTKNNTQSYASWKKQMLPKVTYPAAATTQVTNLQENSKNNNIHDYNMPRTNLYPLRSNTPPLAIPINAESNGYGITSGEITNPLLYRRSLESCNNNVAYQQIRQPFQQQSPHQVLPLTQTATQAITNSPRDILTICAGTQTDAISESCKTVQGLQDVQWSNLASKKDVDDVLQLVQDMRHEQLRIVKMLETLLFTPQIAMKPVTRDVSVQVDIKENVQILNDGAFQVIGQQPVATNKFIQHLKPAPNILQTPKGKPMAQSTTYRPNSPQSQRLVEVASAPTYQQPPNAPTGLTKSSSDTSLAMNELALKYLPNEKLAEILNELNMNCPSPPATQTRLPDPSSAATNNPSTPVRGNIENFERTPSDISNASYKYLKKYRLLPEDHVNDHNNRVGGENINENHHTPQYNTPHRQQQQYDDVRNLPNNYRQTPAKCSPYAVRLPLSPLARASPPQHIVDLDNIKYQPKFL